MLAACSMVGQSDLEPMISPTSGCIRNCPVIIGKPDIVCFGYLPCKEGLWVHGTAGASFPGTATSTSLCACLRPSMAYDIPGKEAPTVPRSLAWERITHTFWFLHFNPLAGACIIRAS